MVEGGSGKYRGAASDNSRLKRPRIEPYNVVTPSRNASLRLSGSGNKSMDNTVDQHSFGEITPFHSHDRSGHLTEEEEEVLFILDESLIPTSSTPLPPLDKNNTPFFDHSKEVISQILWSLIRLFTLFLAIHLLLTATPLAAPTIHKLSLTFPLTAKATLRFIGQHVWDASLLCATLFDTVPTGFARATRASPRWFEPFCYQQL